MADNRSYSFIKWLFIFGAFIPQIRTYDDCKGEWRYPSRCSGYGCDYKALWEYLDDVDEIMFTISTKNRNKWTGIGFSNNKLMPKTDAVLGLVEESGRFFLMDTYLTSYEIPQLDSSQDIKNMSAWRENGITSLRFHRRRITKDQRDFQFSDQNCPYFVFPIQGGVFNAVNKRIRKHELTPIVSENKVCVRSCRPPSTTSMAPVTVEPTQPKPTVPVSLSTKTQETSPSTSAIPPSSTTALTTTRIVSSSTTSTTTTTTTPSTTRFMTTATVKKGTTSTPISPLGLEKHTFEIKLPKAWKTEFGSKESEEFIKFKNQVSLELGREIKPHLTGLNEIEVIDLIGVEEEANSVIAKIKITSSSEDNQFSSLLNETLYAAIKDGKLGRLSVDPSHLMIKPTIGKSDDQWSTIPGLTDEQLKWVVIIGGVAALVILVIIQALCMIWKDKKTTELNVVKEKNTANSHWKDYSATTTSSAYSYENFAVNDEPDGTEHKANNGPNRPNEEEMKDNKSSNPNSTMERMRPQKPNSQGRSNGQNRKDPGYQIRHPQHPPILQPDFYFMPHQRRYSGEVVRVFVDYNNPNYSPK